MKLSLIKIGNSQGFRIPQAVLKQCGGVEEFDLEVKEGSIILNPIIQKEYEMNFNNIEKMDNVEIREMLRKIQPFTLAVSLIGTSPEVRNKLYTNMSERAGDLIRKEVDKLSDMDGKQLIVEMHRAEINSSLQIS